MKNILIFASGSGSNAENIIKHFQNNSFISVNAVLTNNTNAKVLEKANRLGVKTEIFNKNELLDGSVLKKIKSYNPDLIVLAGFLLQFPEHIINLYENKIINIHPSLLPKYGGKGMYGSHVHQAVLDNNETETGITIHYVTKNYDEGDFIFQKAISIKDCSTVDAIAAKIHALEMENFPQVIEKLLTQNL